MTATAIIWPTLALAAIVYVVWFILFIRRFRHMKAKPPAADDFSSTDRAMRYFEPVEMPANNLRNLFEMPVLYFALVPLLLITHLGTEVQVGLAWVYVILRGVHSAIHVGPNVIVARFGAYFASCIVLAAMWIGFAIDLGRLQA